MAQSLSKLYVHLIFHIKTTSPRICEEDLERVYSYIGQLVNNTGCNVLQVGGTEDHVHILFLLSKTESISHVVEARQNLTSKNPHFAFKTGEKFPQTFRLKSLIFITEK